MSHYLRLIALTAVLVIIGFMVSGCGANPKQIELKRDALGAQFSLKTQQLMNSDLVILKCPTNGCTIGNLTIKNPNAVSGVGAPIQFPEDEWARVADRAMGVIGTLGGIWLGGEASKGIIDATGGAISGAMGSFGNSLGTAVGAIPEPTVVLQPEPVTQPTPIVVEQPPYNDPIVVIPPDPIIVEPYPIEPVIIQ